MRPSIAATRRVTTLVAAPLVLLAALTACSPVGPGSGGGSSTPAASAPAASAPADAQGQCADVLTEIQTISDEVGRLPGELGSDPATAAATMRSLGERVTTLGDGITDPGLRTRVDAFTTAVQGLAQTATEISQEGADPLSAIGKVQAAAQAVGDAERDLRTYCGG